MEKIAIRRGDSDSVNSDGGMNKNKHLSDLLDSARSFRSNVGSRRGSKRNELQ